MDLLTYNIVLRDENKRNEQMTRLLVVGIGGVGGYIGGILAREFYEHPDLEIFFFARGANLSEIKKSGLHLIGPDSDFKVRPKAVTDKADELPKMDYVIICTKNYSLGQVLGQLKPAIRPDTVILPLQNGITNTAVISQFYPDNRVLTGCIHMISRIIAPGVIQYFGGKPHLIYGTDFSSEKYSAVERLHNFLQQSGIEATLTEQAEQLAWEKFVFISAIATTTTFYDKSIGEIRDDQGARATLDKLLDESLSIASVNKSRLPEDTKARLLKKIESIPYNSTSSMHSDFQKQNTYTELDSLTGYIVFEGIKHKISTPVYQEIYQILKQKLNCKQVQVYRQ